MVMVIPISTKVPGPSAQRPARESKADVTTGNDCRRLSIRTMNGTISVVFTQPFQHVRVILRNIDGRLYILHIICFIKDK